MNSGTNVAGLTQPVRVTASNVSGGLLNALGVSPAMGRLISPADDDPAAPATADISYGLWKSTFGGDPNVVGRTTTVDGQTYTIIGSMSRLRVSSRRSGQPEQMGTGVARSNQARKSRFTLFVFFRAAEAGGDS